MKDKGNDAFSAGNYTDAVNFYTKAIEIDSGNHVLYSNRSAAYAKAGKYDEALKDANKVLDINPTWVKGLSRKVAALIGMKRHDEAFEIFTESKFDFFYTYMHINGLCICVMNDGCDL